MRLLFSYLFINCELIFLVAGVVQPKCTAHEMGEMLLLRVSICSGKKNSMEEGVFQNL